MPRQLLLMLAITVSLCAGTDPAEPSEDSITLCGVVLHIGAERDVVMHPLASACDLKPADSEGKSWKLYEKGNHSVEIGSVMFFSGKVGLVTKAWATDGDEMGLADALYFASRGFVIEGRHASCSIGADQFDEPGISARRVTITCGRKDIVLVAGRAKGLHARVDVSENLR